MGINRTSVKMAKAHQGKGQNERYYPFEGIRNFRDMGGYPTQDGRRIKWGVLYRSGQLSDLTPKDQKDFKALDIELICDFRYEGEQHRSPTQIEEARNVNILNLPIKTGSFRSFFEKIGVQNPGPDDMLMVMKEIYRNFVLDHAPSYADMFRHIMRTEKATLIHCSAGKDRTGFGSAMILAALGVEKDTIMEDYMLSTQYFSADSAMEIIKKDSASSRRFSFDLDTLRPVYEVYPEYLQTAFEEIEKHFDSMDHYFEQALGITLEGRKKLRDKYLE